MELTHPVNSSAALKKWQMSTKKNNFLKKLLQNSEMFLLSSSMRQVLPVLLFSKT